MASIFDDGYDFNTGGQTAIQNPLTPSAGPQTLSPTYTGTSANLSSSFDWGNAGQTAAMFLPAITSFLGASSAADDINRKNDATLRTIESMSDSLEYSLHSKANQLRELDRVVGDKMSMSGLEQMKREGRLRAAGAETGVANINDVITDSYQQENFKIAAILRDSDIAKNNVKQSMVAERLGFTNDVNSIRSGMPSSSSAFLQTLGAGFSGFNSGLTFLSQAGQERVLGVDTTGEG